MMSCGVMDAASPRRRPRERAIMEMAKVHASAVVWIEVVVSKIGGNHVRSGVWRSRSAAGESFQKMVGMEACTQPRLCAKVIAAKYVRTVDPATPRGRSVSKNLWTTIRSVLASGKVRVLSLMVLSLAI